MPNKSMVVKIDNEAARILNDISGKSNLSKSYIVSEMIKSAHPQTEYEQNIQAERAYGWVLNFVAVNNNKFQGSDVSECWGKIDDEYIYFNSTKFRAVLKDGGFNATSFLSWLKANNLIDVDKNQTSKNKKIGKIAVRCIWLKIEPERYKNGFREYETDENPFEKSY